MAYYGHSKPGWKNKRKSIQLHVFIHLLSAEHYGLASGKKERPGYKTRAALFLILPFLVSTIDNGYNPPIRTHPPDFINTATGHHLDRRISALGSGLPLRRNTFFVKSSPPDCAKWNTSGRACRHVTLCTLPWPGSRARQRHRMRYTW